MIYLTSYMKKAATRFLRSEDGTATLQFAIAFPATALIFSLGYEGGMSSARQVMLEDGLQKTVREVRIGTLTNPTHESLIERICSHASLIPDCLNQVRLEMIPADVEAWDETLTDGEVVCRDRNEDASAPLLEFTNTDSNNGLLLLRACALFDPLFANIGLGKAMATENGTAYALTAISGYVVEPF